MGARERVDGVVDRLEGVARDEKCAAEDLELGAELVDRGLTRVRAERPHDRVGVRFTSRRERVRDRFSQLHRRRRAPELLEPRVLLQQRTQDIVLAVMRAQCHLGEPVDAPQQPLQLVVPWLEQLGDDVVEHGTELERHDGAALEHTLCDFGVLDQIPPPRA